MSTDTDRSDGDPPVDQRWRLHRGGIVNIWQYAEHTFDLSGGRAVFQGTNGSGKSRTLELLLPLCLDGDLRQLGSKGFDTVSVRRLMLDEYPGGPNRIGYAWVELRRETPSGEEFLTCGVGVKASKTSQSISDSWRFITESRVGFDVYLVGTDRVPLGPAQLRETLGTDALFDEQSFRSRIAETVYGVPAARYGDLLHLQRTLRNPDVGLKVLEGQLEQILSDALPPLDNSLIERLASSFDDLESIRENIVRLGTAEKALGDFLTTYSGYAWSVLRDRANAMTSASEKLHTKRSELDDLDARITSCVTDRESVEQTIAELDKREGELESSIDALRSHPAYTEFQNLRDRQRLVDSARSAAATALDTANRHRGQEERSVESVVTALRRLASDSEAAAEATTRLRRQLASAGVEPSTAGQPQTVEATNARTVSETVRTSPESDVEPTTVERQVAPEVDADALEAGFRATIGACERARAEATTQAAVTLSLQQQAKELDAEQGKVSELQQRAKQAQLTATEAAGRRHQAHQSLAEAAAAWAEQVRNWTKEQNLSTVGFDAGDPDRLVADREMSRQARERARAEIRPELRRAGEYAAEARRQLDERVDERDRHEAELAGLRDGKDADAAGAPGTPGAAFYRLVDFAPSLSESERAGLEAALEASGLLKAWVMPDGSVTNIPELVAQPATDYVTSPLAALLTPVDDPDCPVPHARVSALLNSVSIAEGAGFSVSTQGTWQSGVLHGQSQKEAAEFVGEGARAAARNKRIVELEAILTGLREHVAKSEHAHHAAVEEVTAWERAMEAYPDDSELLTAHARLATASETAEDADNHAKRLREQHEHADQRGQAARSALARSAAEADLPPDSQLLEAAHTAATEAVLAADALHDVVETRCRATLADFRELALHHDAAVADRMEAESQAEQRCATYAEHAAALTELTDAVGGEAEQIADTVEGLEKERADLRKQLPQARERFSEIRESTARLETRRESCHAQLAGKQTEATAATTAFRTALRAPGLWSAALAATSDNDTESLNELAFDSSQPDQTTLETAARLFTNSDNRKTGTEATVLNRFHALQGTLSGNYDIAADDHDGILVVTVTGEAGGQPVAEAARNVSERLHQQRDYLNERYQLIFADYLIRDLAERLQDQIAIAEDLCARMNDVLDGARSSQGVHVQLDWQPAAALDEDMRSVISLVRTPIAERSGEQEAALRKAFTELIESQRESVQGGYAEILARALDYRTWFAFTVRVRDHSPDGKSRVRRLRQLSSGETRLVSYVTLFAAAAAFYDAVSVSAAGNRPLRLVLLDEAFERLDDPTIARMLGLLVDLDMDWVITWPNGWGVSPKIPKMHIYDVLRPRSGHGIACTHTTWNGNEIALND